MYFFVYYIYYETANFWVCGMAIFCNVVIVVNLKIFLISCEVSGSMILGIVISIGTFFLAYFVESLALYTVDVYNTFNE